MAEKTFLQHLETRSGVETELRQPSTDDLDLANLPDRLDDAMLARVQDIASSPLPPEQPCDERHFNQCLRVMLSVLPKRAQDDVSGELFVGAYQRKLGKFSNAAISFLADKALERCRWFPTIAECYEILGDYRRSDDVVLRKIEAGRIAMAEDRARLGDRRRWQEVRHTEEWTEELIASLSPPLVNIGLACGALTRDENGKVIPAPIPEEIQF